MLSRLAREFAAEIAQHDWSDAPWRIDRAGHDRTVDTNRGSDQLTPKQTDNIRLNVTWVVAQVLGHADPNLDIVEFSAAAGVKENRPGILRAGLRAWNALYDRPGSYESEPVTATATAHATASAPASKLTQHRSGVLKAILDLDDSSTWADLRRFVELGVHESDDAKLFIEYDPMGNNEIVGLSVYANV